MKRLVFFIAVMFFQFGMAIHSQTIPAPNTPEYLYASFEKGKIRTKNLIITEVLLNYCTANQELVFEEHGNRLILTGLENIDTVYIKDKKFVPIDYKIYEVMLHDSISLLIEYHSKITNESDPKTDYGSWHSTGPTRYETIQSLSGAHYTLEPSNINNSVTLIPIQWILKGNKMFQISNEKQFIKVFPDHAEEIKKYIKIKKVDIDNQQDMIRLISYLNELIK